MQQNREQRRNDKPQEPKEFDEKVVQVSRVSKKTKGGNNMGFSVVMVVGDKKGRVGVGLGKGKDVLSAIKKGVKKAKRHLITVPMNGTTIPFPIELKLGSARIMLKPAPKGSGVIAGGPIRSVVDAAGIRDISSKIKGTANQASNVYATFEALKQISSIVEHKGIKLKSIAQVEEEEKMKLKEIDQASAKASAGEVKSQEVKAEKKEEKTEKVEKKPRVKKTVTTEK
ncbi:30S ribosomal protein S5 [Candidatus Cerribacteria bacterium 'Amazon FNV 2010 28 9']|uniref:Small ribosomal subunit protein uS5 n=1 Tax=Candidatus Cerribacteria bacterium 'Amazon FNV 2010 28 9' TaxID=2081795 RepID=A0A317JTB5_9BACT|nr:MAG: 30S ribosomal protein S5 [Candidatus Cerribacteria bacterium 'Amazon FNV 2010 28 9']